MKYRPVYVRPRVEHPENMMVIDRYHAIDGEKFEVTIYGNVYGSAAALAVTEAGEPVILVSDDEIEGFDWFRAYSYNYGVKVKAKALAKAILKAMGITGEARFPIRKRIKIEEDKVEGSEVYVVHFMEVQAAKPKEKSKSKQKKKAKK